MANSILLRGVSNLEMINHNSAQLFVTLFKHLFCHTFTKAHHSMFQASTLGFSISWESRILQAVFRHHMLLPLSFTWSTWTISVFLVLIFLETSSFRPWDSQYPSVNHIFPFKSPLLSFNPINEIEPVKYKGLLSVRIYKKNYIKAKPLARTRI